MALTSEPDQVVYDPAEGLMHFFIASGPAPVRCAISKAALVALEDDALAGADAMVVTYRRLRELIHRIVERKRRARQFELGGRVVVRLEDVIALLPEPKSSAEAVAWLGIPRDSLDS